MLYFQLADGRHLTLANLHLYPTSAFLNSKNGHKDLDEWIRKLVREHYPGDRTPYLIRWPEATSVPTTLCIGSFHSNAVSVDNGGGYSMLVICWFVWHLDRHLREIIDPGLSSLQWDAHALDFAWW
jgi:hypothetical protein